MFTQLLVQAHIKENIKAPRHWPLCGEFIGEWWIPRTKASNAENFSIWWRHHDIYIHKTYLSTSVKWKLFFLCIPTWHPIIVLALCRKIPTTHGLLWCNIYYLHGTEGWISFCDEVMTSRASSWPSETRRRSQLTQGTWGIYKIERVLKQIIEILYPGSGTHINGAYFYTILNQSATGLSIHVQQSFVRVRRTKHDMISHWLWYLIIYGILVLQHFCA